MSRELRCERNGMENPVLIKSGTTVVAEVFTWREPSDQYETAALFAAAPDLLAALRDIIDLAVRGAKSGNDAEATDLWMRGQIARARAAIAKAEGVR